MAFFETKRMRNSHTNIVKMPQGCREHILRTEIDTSESINNNKKLKKKSEKKTEKKNEIK